MEIDIDRLNESELRELNHRIVERLRLMARARAHERMLQFRIGDRVSFDSERRGVILGTLTRFNHKSVTVVTEGGQRWNVAPHFLRRVVDGDAELFREADLLPHAEPDAGAEPRAIGP